MPYENLPADFCTEEVVTARALDPLADAAISGKKIWPMIRLLYSFTVGASGKKLLLMGERICSGKTEWGITDARLQWEP